MKRIVLLIVTMGSLLINSFADEKKGYRDASLSVEDRVADLLRQMTLEEKLIQVSADVLRKADMDSLYQLNG